MTIADIIKKRKELWQDYLAGKKPNLDEDFRTAAVREILSNKSLMEEIIEKPYLLIEVAFTVVDKKQKTVPFFLNDVQKDFIKQYETHGTRKPYFILKGRQQGFTTLITAIQLCYAIVTGQEDELGLGLFGGVGQTGQELALLLPPFRRLVRRQGAEGGVQMKICAVEKGEHRNLPSGVIRSRRSGSR